MPAIFLISCYFDPCYTLGTWTQAYHEEAFEWMAMAY